MSMQFKVISNRLKIKISKHGNCICNQLLFTLLMASFSASSLLLTLFWIGLCFEIFGIPCAEPVVNMNGSKDFLRLRIRCTVGSGVSDSEVDWYRIKQKINE